ncbi:MAG: MFS transporter [Chloroflexota bacterium]
MTTTTISQSVQRRITGTIFASQSLFSAAFIASFTLTSIIAADLTGNDRWAGIPSTVTLLGRATMGYPIGWLMDRIGRRPGLALGYIIACLGMIISALGVINESFIMFCLGTFCLGMGRAASDQGRYAAAEVYTLTRRAKVIGLIVFAGTIGAVLGPRLVPLSSDIAESLGLAAQSGPYFFASMMIAGAALFTFTFLRPDPMVLGKQLAIEEGEVKDGEEERPLSEIFSSSIVRLAVLAMVLGQIVMTLIMVITPLHMDHLSHSVDSISWVIMSHALGMFALSSVTGWLIDRAGRVTMIITGAAVLVLASVLAPFAHEVPSLAFALFLLGLGWNFCFISGSSLLSDALRPSERGRAQGTSEVMVALASGTGSFSTGSVFTAGGITAVGAVGLALSLLLIAAAVWFNQLDTTKLAKSV